jgi:hypothetical protein
MAFATVPTVVLAKRAIPDRLPCATCTPRSLMVTSHAPIGDCCSHSRTSFAPPGNSSESWPICTTSCSPTSQKAPASKASSTATTIARDTRPDSGV